MKAYPTNLDHDVKMDLQIRRLLCSYTAVCTTTFAARKDPSSSMYRTVCSEAMYFRQSLQSLDPTPVILSKLGAVLVFEFEAQVYLKSWTDLGNLIEYADRYNLSSLPLQCMADLILSSNAPSDASYSLLETITSISLRSKELNVTHVSRWLRVLFNVALSRDLLVITNLATRIVQVIRESQGGYPVDEIQYLAARAFNHAIDVHQSDPERCHKMCEIALSCATYAADDALKMQIQQNYAQIVASLNAHSR